MKNAAIITLLELKKSREELDQEFELLESAETQSPNRHLEEQKDWINQKILIVENKMQIASVTFQIINQHLQNQVDVDVKLNVLSVIANHPVLKESEERIGKAQQIVDELTDNREKALHNLTHTEILNFKRKSNKERRRKVEGLIQDNTTRECAAIDKYILQFLAGEGTKLVTMKVVVNLLIVQVEIAPICDFIGSVERALRPQFPELGEQVYCAIENYIFPTLYHTILKSFELQEFDEFISVILFVPFPSLAEWLKYIQEQCAKFEYLSQEALHIKPEWVDKSDSPYQVAIVELRNFCFRFTPRKKMLASL